MGVAVPEAAIDIGVPHWAARRAALSGRMEFSACGDSYYITLGLLRTDEEMASNKCCYGYSASHNCATAEDEWERRIAGRAPGEYL